MEGENDPMTDVHPLWIGSDPHGRSALLLVESLLHGLIARLVFTVSEAIEIIEVASEAAAEIDHEFSNETDITQRSLDLLASISYSLSHDINRP